ncbi:HlyD family type I secretion periplasmic adaptor subunit [Aureimonas sp. AU12]|uniref:HlyD family type I secretion periplasmic adaptor subunit n=1 Tax=Aureimonas sp. AU12 TaxID=1638161 RepID=UPI0007838C22|nr:HlyD family type I secretion periplasmic adaptor subunit [Aureimonas sp. AU12]
MTGSQTEKALSRSLRRTLLVSAASVAVMFGGVGTWAATTELAGAVIASGRLAVDGNVKKVQHPTGGIAAELLVEEGRQVETGDVLARLDATVTRANLVAASSKLDQLFARRARLEAERDSRSAVSVPDALLARVHPAAAETAMTEERRLFDDRGVAREGQKARLREQIGQLREQIGGLDLQQQAKAEEMALIFKELEGQRALFDKGLTSMGQVNALDRNATRLKGERGQLIASMASARGRVAETELQLQQVDQTMREEVARELRDVANEQSAVTEDEVKALDQLRHIEIRAPIAGTIHKLAIHTVGGVIRPAETLMEIVPRGAALTIEARIAPQDIDQVEPGQTATLRLSAFNRSTTPELFGTVLRMSADLETDEKTGLPFYEATIALPASERARIPGLTLVPGMPVEAFIATADRTVASFFLKPIQDHASRVFRED